MNYLIRVVAGGVGISVISVLLACDQTPSLATQVAGWWVDPESGGCYRPQQTECGGGDCVGYAVLGLLPNHRYIDGHVAYSAKLGTMSTMGTLLGGTYQVSDAAVVVSQTSVADTTLPVTFSSQEMNFGNRVEIRPPTALATALDRAAAGNSMAWQSYPVTK